MGSGSRHSKNSTARGFFTHHEKAELDYGTKKQRLGRDSLKDFDACHLCLQKARDPMCCPKGHIGCRECLYENLLAQKKSIQRLQEAYETQKKSAENDSLRNQQAAKDAEIHLFQQTETKFLPNQLHGTAVVAEEAVLTRVIDGKVYRGTKTATGIVYIPDGNSISSSDNTAAVAASGGSSNHSASVAVHNVEEVDSSLTLEEKEAKEKVDAVKALQHSSSSRKVLPSFWLPSLTPAAKETIIELPKKHTMCTATDEEHEVSIKKLISVKFTESSEKDSIGQPLYMCPSCMKTFTNSSKLMLSKNCGHVLCHKCCKMFVSKSQKCYVCEGKCKGEKDLIEIQVEGTGFAAGGVAEAAREGLAFQ